MNGLPGLTYKSPIPHLPCMASQSLPTAVSIQEEIMIEMIRENERRKWRDSVTLAAWVIVAGIVAAACLFPLAQAKEKENPEDYTRVYPFTYEETFQAAQK